MLNTYKGHERELPWWAMGAPAIGVPLMVLLLAVTAPERVTPVDGADAPVATEQMEIQAVEVQTVDGAARTPGACGEFLSNI